VTKSCHYWYYSQVTEKRTPQKLQKSSDEDYQNDGEKYADGMGGVSIQQHSKQSQIKHKF